VSSLACDFIVRSLSLMNCALERVKVCEEYYVALVYRFDRFKNIHYITTY